ncbi:hypothetical protein JOC54_000516 [Alkalihalobacillus xiaoxiensis]|uniref:Uncharacterized protein n=1 Tax=Shouchella xiaoxiensis TaxID=766895 RepID=A0ABS2SR27_9BACI|nr:hypothetical protein [Shouchella xiaoxiensis]MBM7837285.1 hypothetical protein [Shouchella xiaoxiensis]
MDQLIGALALLIIACTVKKASSLYLWAGLVFFISGLIFYFISVPSTISFFSLFGSMISLLALVFVLPFMSTIISVGKYDRALGQLINRPPPLNMNRLYRRTSVMTYLLTLFLNVATVPVVVATVKERLVSLRDVVIQRFFAHSILRAYALVLLWSPTEVLVASTIDLTGTNYLLLFPTLLTISILFISFDWVLHHFQLKKIAVNMPVSVTEQSPFLYRKLIELGIAIVCFITVLLISNELLAQSFLFTVTVLIIPFTFIWAAVIKKQKRFTLLSIAYVKGNTSQLHGLFFLFLAAGFFVEVFPYTILFEYMNSMFVHTYFHASLFWFYLLVALCVFSFALIGFHPLISIALISPFLSEAIARHPYGMSILLIGVGLSTVMIGPFNITPTILAMQLKANPYRIIRKNLLFALCYLLFIVVVAFLFSRALN